MIAFMDPEPAAAVLVGEGHAPLWQYFLRLQKKPPRRAFSVPDKTASGGRHSGLGQRAGMSLEGKGRSRTL
jgi:hypothetical protein